MNSYLVDSYHIIQLALLVIFELFTLYIFIFAIAGIFYKQKYLKLNGKKRRIAVLIPGYKEDSVIIDVAKQALNQSYPNDLYDVIIIADSFQAETISALSILPIKVIEVSFEKSTKSKALNKAMSQLPESYDIAVILDADNVMAHDFLDKINASFDHNFIAVQGHRAAKNLNNGLAILDAISEEINNNIFRRGHRALGLSSAIIGSGMAFDYMYFKNMMLSVDAIGGFDKEIELKILKAGKKIEYLENALVYDEKVQKDEVFTNQRRRWLSAQLHYFKQDIGTAFLHLITKGNVDYFDKAIQFIQPPRILLIGLIIVFSFIFAILNFLIDTQFTYTILWIIVLTMSSLSLLISIPKKFYCKENLAALASIPKGMLLMLKSLLRIKGANKQFLHTKHGSN